MSTDRIDRSCRPVCDIVAAALIVGTLLGLFVASQVLVRNGAFGLTRDAALLSLYLVVPSWILSIVPAALLYALISRFATGRRSRRRITTLLLLAPTALLLWKTSSDWIAWGGSDFATYSLLSAIFAVSLTGILACLASLPGARGRRRALDALLLIGFVALLLGGYRSYRALWTFPYDPDLTLPVPADTDRGLLVIGIDSATWHVMDRLLEQGDLPVMASLIEEGVRGPLETIHPTHSSIIWSSIATGKHYRKHGVDGFAFYNIPTISRSLQVKGTVLEMLLIPLRRTKLVTITPFSSEARRCDAIWNLLSRCGLSIGVVNWMGSWPVEAVDGFMVSGRFLTSKPGRSDARLPGLIWPDSLLTSAEAQMHVSARDRLPAFVDEIDASDALYADFIDGLEHVERELDLTISLTRAYRPDALLFYEHFLDMIQHRFWRFMEPESYEVPIPAEQVERYHDIIRFTYMYFDHVVGRLIDELGEGRDVVVLSDHGMEPIPLTTRNQPMLQKMVKSKGAMRTLSAHHWMGPPGILIARGDGIRRGGRVPPGTGIYDILPTLLYMLGLPAAEDMDGRLIEEILEPSRLADRPPFLIPTYESRPPTARGHFSRSDSDKEILDSFRALGYIQ